MAGFEQRAKRYPTDLTDEEWRFIQPFLSPAPKRERKPTTDLRAVLDALRYLARTGGGWRMLPNDFPPWQTVYWWFRRLVRKLLFRTLYDVTLMLDRARVGREQSPSAAVIDSRSIKPRRRKAVGLTPARRFSAASVTSLWIPTDGC